MRVSLLRHAQTRGNLLGQYVGSSNLSLCGPGRARAAAIPPRADVKQVYTSHLARAVQTAEILYPNAKIIPCQGLAEMDFGAFEQRHWRSLEQDAAYRAWVDSGCEAACPGGEAKAAFTRRCVEAFAAVAAREESRGADALHFVVHGGTIMAILSELALPARAYFDWTADFCGGYLLEWSGMRGGDARPLRLLEAIRPKEPAKNI